MDSSRLIVVSNRLPVALSESEGKWDAQRSAGGLATAMDPILKQNGRDLDRMAGLAEARSWGRPR